MPITAHEAMVTAISASEDVRGTTSPNPPVGCVIVAADETLVGIGASAPPGGPHAEVAALRAAGGRARGGTAYVTLEPCAHTGRTPPCTRALIEAGLTVVHFAVTDPNPIAAGGAEELRAAGIAVRQGLMRDEVAGGPLRAWLHYARTGVPHVTWKFASTMDGRVAAMDGTSRWVSSLSSRAEVHRLRGRVDAIVVGRGTVLADDPALIAREQDGTPYVRQPLRVVVGNGDIPVDARVNDAAAPMVHLRTHDPNEVLAALAERGVVDVLLEGGPRLAAGFVRASAVHRILAYFAPKLLGGGPAVLAGAGVPTITEALSFEVESVVMIGPDVRVSMRPAADAGEDGVTR